MTFLRTMGLFGIAAVCEIVGGYLVWQWWRGAVGPLVGAGGAILLILYGIVPTYQDAHFGRVYAAYGGVFVIGALLWSGWADGIWPDRYDLAGAALCLAGVAVMMFAPRT
jgi:small multidrug resistance family-3 protein